MLISTSILTERFCCDLEACHGACCIEGDAGAPVTLDEIGEIEASLDAAWPLLSAQAQAVIDRQGVAYTDREGELVTSIVNGKDCVFTFYAPSPLARPAGTLDPSLTANRSSLPANRSPLTANPTSPRTCLCALEKVCRDGRSRFAKPISCALYPIREKRFAGGLVGLNYHRWDICAPARKRGEELDLPLYRFLREPLIRRFGQVWYDELCEVAQELGTCYENEEE